MVPHKIPPQLIGHPGHEVMASVDQVNVSSLANLEAYKMQQQHQMFVRPGYVLTNGGQPYLSGVRPVSI
jgi:hypothetical protein